VITGFNTDIEYEGVVYHVQTEDKGLDTPIILSLVYVGGAILASKRSPYDDLIVAGFDAAALSERLNRQHKLICAAITAGRIEELKRLNRQGGGAGRKSSRKAVVAKPPAATEIPAATAAETKPAAEAPAQTTTPVPSNGDAAAQTLDESVKTELPSWFEAAAEGIAAPTEKAAANDAAVPEVTRPLPPEDARVQSGAGQPAEEPSEGVAGLPGAEAADAAPAPQPRVEEIIPVELEGELHVSLMEERDYKAGEIVTLRVRVARGPFEAREAVSDATVTVKILGTEFRPLILTSKTDGDGVAVIHAWLPRFTGGRAAILARATHDGFAAELRRPIRHL